MNGWPVRFAITTCYSKTSGTEPIRPFLKNLILATPFQLTKKELEEVITICDNPDRLRFSPQTPFAFTEQGVAMLSGILNSAVAVQASIRIMNAFVAMRHALLSMAPMLARIESAERRQITDQARNEKRFDTIFKAMAGGEFPPQKIFFEGEVFDADAFISKHILSATKSILLIDNWVDIGTLEKLSRKASCVTLEIVTSKKGNKIKTTDIASFTKQYGGLTIRETKAFHDRFLIIDGAKLYHIGASLKDLGNKCFAIATLDATLIPDILAHL